MATISSAIILIIDIFAVSYSKVNLYFENDLVLVGVFLITAWVVGYYVKSANEQIKDLQSLINEDSLTGLYNETYFSESLKRKLELCRRYDLEIALLTIDIDYFKEYNDLYGKEQGNEVIKSIAAIIRECTRKEHIVSRVGGGKFTVLVPGMQLEKAMNLGESIRKAINDEYFKGEEEQPNGRITVSVGISHYPSIAVDEESLIQSSEDALSRAKFFNKNSVEIYNQILENIQKSNNGFVNSVKGLLDKLNVKDKFSYSHVQRVVIYSRLIASQLNLSEEDTNLLVGGAYMHDIGKVNISE
ncbi:MAG: diguanylate cyclase, partial [Clostridium sp.]|uniref:bifunctional diguanylate cyclase/phosphohydrolase n=1 Tax=Clostridium sp. TaxID=1506 RepID=UPI003067B189